MPGAHLVDAFPILDSLPDFMSPWRNEARKKHEYEMGVWTFSFNLRRNFNPENIQLYGRLFLEVKENSKIPGFLRKRKLRWLGFGRKEISTDST